MHTTLRDWRSVQRSEQDSVRFTVRNSLRGNPYINETLLNVIAPHYVSVMSLELMRTLEQDGILEDEALAMFFAHAYLKWHQFHPIRDLVLTARELGWAEGERQLYLELAASTGLDPEQLVPVVQASFTGAGGTS